MGSMIGFRKSNRTFLVCKVPLYIWKFLKSKELL